MSSIVIQPQSEFGKAAFQLDEEMTRFEKLGNELENLNFQSDRGLSRGNELLAEIAQCRERLQANMLEMARALENARERNESTEKTVAVRMHQWQERQNEAGHLLARFKSLGDSVQQLNQIISQLKQPAQTEMSSDEKLSIRTQLSQATEPLNILVEEARKLVLDARTANMKMLERNADSLRQTLQAAKNRINLLADRQMTQ